ncbi:MAG: hypothetical protein LC794_04190 [Acidobacteria bacterium]|nr:hypothetical protein [Acidobacteriota bacterium]
MKSFLRVCLAMVVVVCAVTAAHPNGGVEDSSPFAEARRIGELNARHFYLLSTSVGNYTISQYGLGEVYVGNRKKYFNLKVSGRSRLERVYFLEYEGDLLLLYEAGVSGYLLRLDQSTRRIKRATAISEKFEPPLIKERSAVFGDGAIVPLD